MGSPPHRWRHSPHRQRGGDSHLQWAELLGDTEWHRETTGSFIVRILSSAAAATAVFTTTKKLGRTHPSPAGGGELLRGLRADLLTRHPPTVSTFPRTNPPCFQLQSLTYENDQSITQTEFTSRRPGARFSCSTMTLTMRRPADGAGVAQIRRHCVHRGVDGVRAIMMYDFDAIVCDMMMPTMRGRHVLRRVQQLKRDLCDGSFPYGAPGQSRGGLLSQARHGQVLYKRWRQTIIAKIPIYCKHKSSADKSSRL